MPFDRDKIVTTLELTEDEVGVIAGMVCLVFGQDKEAQAMAGLHISLMPGERMQRFFQKVNKLAKEGNDRLDEALRETDKQLIQEVLTVVKEGSVNGS